MSNENADDSGADAEERCSMPLSKAPVEVVMTTDLPDEGEVLIKRKSGARKDENQILRREQIDLYKSKILREDREKRYLARNGKDSSESPKKKKRVSFENLPSEDKDSASSSKDDYS